MWKSLIFWIKLKNSTMVSTKANGISKAQGIFFIRSLIEWFFSKDILLKIFINWILKFMSFNYLICSKFISFFFWILWGSQKLRLCFQENEFNSYPEIFLAKFKLFLNKLNFSLEQVVGCKCKIINEDFVKIAHLIIIRICALYRVR